MTNRPVSCAVFSVVRTVQAPQTIGTAVYTTSSFHLSLMAKYAPLLPPALPFSHRQYPVLTPAPRPAWNRTSPSQRPISFPSGPSSPVSIPLPPRRPPPPQTLARPNTNTPLTKVPPSPPPPSSTKPVQRHEALFPAPTLARARASAATRSEAAASRHGPPRARAAVVVGRRRHTEEEEKKKKKKKKESQTALDATTATIAPLQLFPRLSPEAISNGIAKPTSAPSARVIPAPSGVTITSSSRR